MTVYHIGVLQLGFLSCQCSLLFFPISLSPLYFFIFIEQIRNNIVKALIINDDLIQQPINIFLLITPHFHRELLLMNRKCIELDP
ncbi:hypothetical protein D3C81_1031890 [compost metagenome]